MTESPLPISPEPRPDAVAPAGTPVKQAPPTASVRFQPVRTLFTGLLMGLANLVPGVSGGTMVLVMGLYDQFIGSIADLSRLKLTRRAIVFLALLAGTAFVTITLLAGPMAQLVTQHTTVMFSLFIGMTLAGTPLLVRRMKPLRWPVIVLVVVGIGGMALIGPPDHAARAAAREAARSGQYTPSVNYPVDFAAGLAGLSAMVLPGISGAHMMLIMGRYEPVLASIAMMKTYLTSAGAQGDPRIFLGILVPFGLGAVISLVGLSNLLKWLLKRHEPPLAGLLLGVLWGSVIAIWPFEPGAGAGDYTRGVVFAAVGFVLVMILARFEPKVDRASASDAAESEETSR